MRQTLEVIDAARPPAPWTIELTLPGLPPSTNNLFANIPGRGRVKTSAYTRWLNQCGLILRAQCKTRMAERCDITIALEDCHPLADASNYLKATEDLLVKLGILEDDNAKYVRSISGVWADIEGTRITLFPCQPNVAKQGRGA